MRVSKRSGFAHIDPLSDHATLEDHPSHVLVVSGPADCVQVAQELIEPLPRTWQ
jgi:hypothetical protein